MGPGSARARRRRRRCSSTSRCFTIGSACTRPWATEPRPRPAPAWRRSPCERQPNLLIYPFHSKGGGPLHPHRGWDHVESLARLLADPMERTEAAGADRGLGFNHLLAPRQVLGKRADVANRRPAGSIHRALGPGIIVGGRGRRGGPDSQILEIERE